MIKMLPSPLREGFALMLYALNTVITFTILIPLIFLKIIIIHSGARLWLTNLMVFFANKWVSINTFILRLTQSIKWDVKGIEGFSTNKSYLVISNHRSWADILVLQHLFNNRIPFLKFFLKRELIWVPLLGIAWWALDFPFMKRYSREYLKKHPERKGKDIETTKKYCERFKYSPISVINFLEGTRFNYEKRESQKSPYRHLLVPRAGGVAIVLSSMGESLSGIIDVTIAYPDNDPPVTFWEFLRGRIRTIAVRVRQLPIPESFLNRNYEQEDAFRQEVQEWTNRLWQEKDEIINQIYDERNVLA